MTQRSGPTLPLIAAGLVTLALTVGCSNGLVTSSPGADPSVTQPSPATTTTSSDTPSVPVTSDSPRPSTPVSPRSSRPASSEPSSASATSGPTVGPSAAGVAACALSDLTVGVTSSPDGGAAGSNYVLLTFENRSGSTCTIYGYPGVSFVGRQDGTQLGVPAVRNRSASASTVRLASGATTTALLQIVNAGNYDPTDCAPTTSDGFRVYPPGSTTSAYVPFQTQACQRDPGSSRQLSISPVGTSR